MFYLKIELNVKMGVVKYFVKIRDDTYLSVYHTFHHIKPWVVFVKIILIYSHISQ